MSHFHGRFIKGDLKEDDSRFLPPSEEADDMVYDFDTHQYVLTTAAVKKNLNLDIDGEYDSSFLLETSDSVYEYLGTNINRNAYDIVEFKIGRTVKGREGIFKALLAQVRYAHRTGADMMEYDKHGISKRTVDILRSDRYGGLGHRGPYAYLVNPDVTDPDGYRNGY